jgi:hypothetical protein
MPAHIKALDVEWRSFRESVWPGADETSVVIREVRRAFFAGAFSTCRLLGAANARNVVEFKMLADVTMESKTACEAMIREDEFRSKTN